jgi:hypothetical protein
MTRPPPGSTEVAANGARVLAAGSAGRLVPDRLAAGPAFVAAAWLP